MEATLQAPADAQVDYMFAGAHETLAAGSLRIQRAQLCVPPGGHADIALTVDRAVVAPGPQLVGSPLEVDPAKRWVGPQVVRISAARTGARCTRIP